MIPVLAACVVVTVVTSVAMNVTVIVSFSCMVKESGFGSEVDEETLSEDEVGPFFWSSEVVSSEGESGSSGDLLLFVSEWCFSSSVLMLCAEDASLIIF